MGGNLKRLALPAFVVAWVVGVGAGVLALADYGSRPAAESTLATEWPHDAPVARDAETPTIVVALHPRCPCSRATVDELAALAANGPGRPRVVALFYAPDGEQDAWAHTDLWDRAAAIEGVTLVVDRGAAVARLFGARTSGQTLVYAPDGTLRFAGGITAGRGHVGENPGLEAAEAAVDGSTTEEVHAPVYGCALDDPDRT